VNEAVTTDSDPPIDPDDELLVAYLDGELDVRARDEVEQRLMGEENLRVRLQDLQASWDFLDVLPETPANDRLVESTLELVVSDIVEKAPRQVSDLERSGRWPWAVGTLCLLAAIGGYAFVSFSRAQELQQQLSDLPLAEDLDAYVYGGDYALMRQLEATKKWNAMVKAARNVGEFRGDSQPIIADTPVEARAEKLTELSVEDRAVLESRWDRYRRMDEDNRNSIRKTAAAVADKSDQESLLATMKTYAAWRETLSDELRDQIESGDPEQRDEAIGEAINQTLARITRRSGQSLNDETIDLIFSALEYFLDSRISDNPQLQDRLDEMEKQFDHPQFAQAGPAAIARRIAIREMLGSFFRGFRPPGGSTPTLEFPPLTDEELLKIPDIMSADEGDHSVALKTLESMYDAGTFGMPNSLVLLTLREWAEETLERKGAFWETEQKSLLQRYKELDPDQRDTIDLLPPKGIKEALDRLNEPRRWRGPPRRRPPSQ
jgi:hypothetical protein